MHPVMLVGLLLTTVQIAGAASPYAGQEQRTIKALSPQEVTDYLDGKGMGLAKAAELNGYPGPTHVLKLAAELQLDQAQLTQTQAIFQSMQGRAKVLGERLVAAEGQLDQQFAGRTVSPESLTATLTQIAHLQGQVRAVHLLAHLQQTAVLSPEQIATYVTLRGYDDGAGHQHDRSHH